MAEWAQLEVVECAADLGGFPALLGKREVCVCVRGSHRTIKCLILRALIIIHGSDRKNSHFLFSHVQ